MFFYYLAFLEDQKAVASALEAFRKYQAQIKKNKYEATDILFVRISYEIWKKFKSRVVRGNPTEIKKYGLGSSISHQISLSPWRDFIKKNKDSDLQRLILVWTLVLKIPESSVIEALKITQGTLRFRLGRGLIGLGESVKSNSLRVVDLVR